jgi:pyrimidine-nucleoside phosphorylase
LKSARARKAAPIPPAVELIAKKREGGALGADEIRALIDGFVSGEVTDYQMSAMAMAIYFRGMTPEETTALTLAMRDSGRVVDLGFIRGPKVDKHSTGGVGDKVSLCLAPLVAACGLYVPMVSGRGLGHTGGTLDKLEAIPGFSVEMSVAAFRKQVASIGCALIGQTADIAPADKRLYALRDVTATVESIPLITASILSKKLAEGIDALVLDVKVGAGAFMKTRESALALARSIVRVGTLAKKRVSAVLTTMDQPLGNMVGNALEAREAFEVLHGGGPADLVEITRELGVEMLLLGKIDRGRAAAERRLDAALKDGSALARMEKVVRAQGGDPRTVREPDRLPKARARVDVVAGASGYVGAIDAKEIGLSSVSLGAGRLRTDDVVDPAVGIELVAKVGDRVERGRPIAILHAQTSADAARVAPRVKAAYSIGKTKPRPAPLIIDVVR